MFLLPLNSFGQGGYGDCFYGPCFFYLVPETQLGNHSWAPGCPDAAGYDTTKGSVQFQVSGKGCKQ